MDYVVSGTIRHTGDSLRITAQLMSVSDGATRWGGRFDEKSADVLQLEDSISEQVARAIIPHLTGDEQRQLQKRGTDSAEAYEAYMRGRYHWNTFTEEGFAQALFCYHQAIALDPDYALAFAGIADYYNWVGVYGVMPFAECSAAAKEAAEKAVALDAALAEAYSALGFAIVTHDFNFAAAERQHQRALELNSKLCHGASVVWLPSADGGPLRRGRRGNAPRPRTRSAHAQRHAIARMVPVHVAQL